MQDEAEYGFISCILIDNKTIDDFSEKISPKMFFNEFCAECYEKSRAMHDRGVSVNPISLAPEVENHKWSREFVMNELKKCFNMTVTSVMSKSFAETIMKDYKVRAFSNLMKNSSLLPADIDNTISDALTKLEALQRNKERTTKTLKQIVSENKDRYFNEHVGEGGLKTGFSLLDDCIVRLEKGDITVIGARPGVGKSAFVAQIIEQVAATNKKVIYFNLEMNESQVYERFVSRISQISMNRVRRAKAFLGNEKEAFDKANEIMSNYEISVSTGSKSISEVKAECRYQNYDLIVIDYLQLIKSDRFYTNRASEVGEISKSAKSLATELNCHVIVLSQLNRVSESRETKEPTIGELRESGDIEQDASNIFLLWNLAEDKNYKGLNVAKQRQGECGKFGVKFSGEFMKFEESELSFDEFLKLAKEASESQFSKVDKNEMPLGW